ncbi:death-associated protein 1 isoform X2 [Dipodomys spectabilis]|uniref:death-associated protein 1 isoform X2 n=1 Tax=Dipodomys spectabilis TaxID=105255 RepID=UPI001C541C52|nr:death-associated protein 1 isoform X2 [Dipodomys spectabilis]
MGESASLPALGPPFSSPHFRLKELGKASAPPQLTLCCTPQKEGNAIPPKPTVFISGVIARGDKDFPPAAAQVAHQKPHASMDKHASPRTQNIQQPRK